MFYNQYLQNPPHDFVIKRKWVIFLGVNIAIEHFTLNDGAEISWKFTKYALFQNKTLNNMIKVICSCYNSYNLQKCKWSWV